MPASRLTADSSTVLSRGGATFARYTAVRKPSGTPSTMAPAVPYTLVRMNGRMPYDGSAAVDAHVLPNRNGTSPIFRMAGMPETIRYTLMSSTHPTVMRPRSKNTPCTTVSRT